MTRRAMVGVLAALAAGFAAFGPRGARKRDGGRIVLDYWEKWTGDEGAAMQRIVDEFNQSQPRIFVRYLATAGVDEKSMVAIAGAAPPDVIGLYNYNVPLFAETGALHAFDELPGAEELTPERYSIGFRPFVTHPDKDGRVRTWAAVSSGGTLALYWNKAIFAEAGLPGPPATIEEFNEYHRRLTVRSGRKLQRVGFIHAEPGWWSWNWGFHFGGRLWDAGTWKSELASDSNVAAYQWIQDHALELGVDEMVTFRSGLGNYASDLNAFLCGKVAMVLQGPWLANIIQSYHDRAADAAGRPRLDYGVVPFPTIASLRDDTRPVGAVESDIVVIPRGVREPEASVEFVRFLQRQDKMEQLALAHFKNSPLAVSSERFRKDHAERGNKSLAAFDAIAQSPRSFITPRTRVWPAMKSEMDEMMEFFYRGAGTAREILTRVQGRTQNILDRHVEQRARRGWPVPAGVKV